MRGLLWFLCMVAVLMWTSLAVAGNKAAVVKKDTKAVQKVVVQKQAAAVQKTAVQKDGAVQKARDTRLTALVVKERRLLLRPFRLLCFRGAARTACRAGVCGID